MVKSPKIRHSKPAGEPLTIDLDGDDVKRVDAGAEPGKAESVKTDSGKAEQGKTEPGKVDSDRDGAAKAAAGRPGGTSAFGRDAGKTPPPSQPRPEPAAKPAAAPKAAEPQRRAGSALLAGLLGGVIALGGAGAAWYGGLIQPPADTAGPAAPGDGAGGGASDEAVDGLRTEIDALRAAIEELRAAPPPAAQAPDLSDVNARIESLATLVEDLRAQLADIGAGGADGDPAALSALRQALAALEARVAALPAAGEVDLSPLRDEIGAASELARQASEAAAQAASAANALAPRIESVEAELSALSARVAEAAEQPGVALAIAASALKAAIDRGVPFTTELDTLARLAPDMPEIEALRPYAATGVARLADIEAGFDGAAAAMIAAGRTHDPDAGLLERLWASATSVVQVRPVGEVEGDDVPAIVARVEVAMRRGDLARAVAEFESLPETARAAGEPYMQDVRARLAADDLVARVLAAALRA